MINLIHITAKGMPAVQAAAGHLAPVLNDVIVGGTFGKQSLLRCMQFAMFGFAKPESFAYAAVGNVSGSNGFGATNPPFDDNSPGTSALR